VAKVFKFTEHLKNQLILPNDVFLPFGRKLNKDNHWVQLVPWVEAEKAMIIFLRHLLQAANDQSADGTRQAHHSRKNITTDRETLALISENP
jgi:hypothetical protein